MFRYILDRLSEPSTWKGIIWFITAFGLVFSPEQQEAIATGGMALVGLISVFIEKGNAHTDEEIASIAQEVHEEQVKKIMSKKNAKTKKSDSDNFFND